MEKVDEYAKIIWDYMLMHQEIKKADAIVALGSNDIRVADRTFELYQQGLAQFIVCTGGLSHLNDVNKTPWEKPEAEIYKQRLVSLGVPENSILLETVAKNTGDNAILLQKYVHENNLNWKSFILVQKPFMERRIYATFRKQYPEADVVVTSQDISYENFMNESEIPKDVFINVMVGDLIRMKEYPKLGFQIEQEIPADVWQAGQELIKLGYDKYLPK